MPWNVDFGGCLQLMIRHSLAVFVGYIWDKAVLQSKTGLMMYVRWVYFVCNHASVILIIMRFTSKMKCSFMLILIETFRFFYRVTFTIKVTQNYWQEVDMCCQSRHHWRFRWAWRKFCRFGNGATWSSELSIIKLNIIQHCSRISFSIFLKEACQNYLLLLVPHLISFLRSVKVPSSLLILKWEVMHIYRTLWRFFHACD